MTTKKRKTQTIDVYDNCYNTIMAFKEYLRAQGLNVRGDNNQFESHLVMAVNMYWSKMNGDLPVMQPIINKPIPTQPILNQEVTELITGVNHNMIQQQPAINISAPSIQDDSLIKIQVTLDAVVTKMMSMGVKLEKLESKVNSPKTKSSSHISNFEQVETITNLSTSLSQLFREQFNGASIEDYHEILANGLSRNSNSVFTQSSNTSEKPTSVMYKFIESFNSQYRKLVTNYIQNETLVTQLSITDNALTNYVKGRYQQLGDMETYTKLTTLKQYDLTLEELTELLEPLKEYSFNITKLLNDDKYKPMSLQSRFKSSFNQEFESCWIDNTITEFTTI